MTERYADRCVNVASVIDVNELASLPLGKEIGRGNNFIMRSLGKIGLGDSEVFCGLKIPLATEVDMVSVTLLREIENVERLLKYAPQFEEQVPRFMLGVSIGEDGPKALLTEDASRGGELNVSPSPQGARLLRVLSEAVRGHREVSLGEEEITDSLLFTVGDEERLLDFTPAPITQRLSRLETDEYISELIFDTKKLIVDIEPGSVLGQSFTEAAV